MTTPASRCRALLILICLAEAVAIAVLIVTLHQKQAVLARFNSDLQDIVARTRKEIAARQHEPMSRESSSVQGGRAQVGDLHPEAARFLALLTDPRNTPLRLKAEEIDFSSGSADLIRCLHLPGDKIRRLADLLAEERFEEQDIRALAAFEHIGDRAILQGMIDKAKEDTDAKIKVELGDQTFAAYERYRDTQYERPLVQRLQQGLSYTDTPLSNEQADQLVMIFAENNSPPPVLIDPRFELVSVNGHFVPKQATLLTDMIMAEAKSVLSDSQFEALQALREQQQVSLQLSQRMKDSN